jgi:hypothetical protein
MIKIGVNVCGEDETVLVLPPLSPGDPLIGLKVDLLPLLSFGSGYLFS